MRKKQLPWNLHYPGHSPMATIIQSPYSFAQTVIPCVKPSSHPILEHSPSTIPSTPFRLQSLSSGSLAILPFQVTFSLTQQPKKPPTLPQTQFFLFLSISNQAINEMIRDTPPIYERVAAVYKHRRVSWDAKQINNEKNDVLIARLRSGHHPSLKQYLHWLDPSQDPTYPNCCQEQQDLLHWFCDCPALITMRQVFGCHQGSLEWLATRPGDVVAYARKTLVNLDA